MRTERIIFTSDPPVLNWAQYTIYGSVILYFGRELLIPVSFALLISIVLYPVCRWLERKGLGRLTAIILSLSILIILSLLIVTLFVSQFILFLNEWPSLQSKLIQSVNDISRYMIDAFGLTKEQQQRILTKISYESSGDLFYILRSTISASALSTVVLVLISVYSVLILYYRSYWVKLLFRLFPGERKEGLYEIIQQAIDAYYNFFKGMAIVYLIVGSLNSVGLLLLGVPHAILFGFIASMLTFIPYVGIIIGSLLPITMAWITYDSIWYPLGIIGIFTFVQYLKANVIFPVAVSNRLHVNMFVMLLAIFAGGILWGVAGMILFVPFVGIAKLIADHNPKWRTISMILALKIRAK